MYSDQVMLTADEHYALALSLIPRQCYVIKDGAETTTTFQIPRLSEWEWDRSTRHWTFTKYLLKNPRQWPNHFNNLQSRQFGSYLALGGGKMYLYLDLGVTYMGSDHHNVYRLVEDDGGWGNEMFFRDDGALLGDSRLEGKYDNPGFPLFIRTYFADYVKELETPPAQVPDPLSQVVGK